MRFRERALRCSPRARPRDGFLRGRPLRETSFLSKDVAELEEFVSRPLILDQEINVACSLASQTGKLIAPRFYRDNWREYRRLLIIRRAKKGSPVPPLLSAFAANNCYRGVSGNASSVPDMRFRITVTSAIPEISYLNDKAM